MANLNRYFKIMLLLTVVGSSFLFLSSKAQAIEIELYSYHDFPPFVTGDAAGLTYDLADYLAQKSNQKYQFKVRIYPRKRLDSLLNTNSDLIVPWVSPAWFGENADTKFKWSSAMLSDGNSYISPISAPLDILDRSFLYGRVLGGRAWASLREYR